MPPRPSNAKRQVRRPSTPQRAIQTALAGMAHEVRTPLNGILVLAELLAASDLPPREREWAAALKSAADHLATLTTVVIDGARAGAGKLTPRRETFDPTALAAALAETLKARAAVKGLAVDIAIADSMAPAVEGDPVLIRAAAENLIDNATKFTERGRIAFAVRAEPAAAGTLRLVFEVADDGVGLTAAEVRRLFRPFGQANTGVARRYGGSGLGLAFARKVARAMSGDLTVTSAPGAGSRFRFEALVGSRETPSASRSGARKGSALAERGLRILCAEDNPYGRVMFNTIAGSFGHRIDFVTSGEAAVEAADRGGYDIVLMDVTLPGMDGVEATRRIRALPGSHARTPIVGISGRGGPDEESAARAAGMDDYLVKPVSPSALAAAIDAVVGR